MSIKNVTLSIFNSGSYIINATYCGDHNYLPISANSTLFVERPRTNLNISVKDTFVGNPVLINFTVNSAITGEIFNKSGGILRIYVGGDVYSVNITNGKANLTVPDLSISTYNIIVIYSGDDNYAGCDGYNKFEVKGRETGLNITLNKHIAFVGDNIIVTVNVEKEIQNYPVYLYVNGELYTILLTTDGEVIFNVTNLEYGEHNISAVFMANAIFGSATNSTVVNILKNNPNMMVEAVSDSQNNVSIKFTLPDDATGTINITYNGEVLQTLSDIGGSKTIKLNDEYQVGNHTFIIIYSGDDKYYNVSESATVEVGKISDYEMNITSSAIVRDQDVTIFVNLPKIFGDNGKVNLTINGILYTLNLDNGSVNQTVHTTGLDNITVVAFYSGWDKYDSKTVSKVFIVEPIDDYKMNITVDSAYVGEEVVLNINAPVQFDNVNFTIMVNGVEDNVLIKDGKGYYIINNAPLGHVDVTVTSVDNKYYVARTVNSSFDVIKKTAELNIVNIPETIYVNGEFNITVSSNLKDDASIVVYVDGVKKAEQLWSNNNFTINGLTSGDHIITVSFEGNDYYNSNSNSTGVNVLKLASSVSVSARDIDVGENLEVNVNASGNGSATITIYNSTGGLFGEYILSINEGKGKIIVPDIFTKEDTYTINITYNGDDIYNISTNKTSVTVNLATNYDFKVITNDAYVGENVSVNVTLPSNANKNVILTLPNGTNITQKLNNGFTRFIISGMAYGNYTVSLTYEGDNNYGRGTKIGKFSIFKNTLDMDLRFNTTDDGNVSVVNSILQGDVTCLIITLPTDARGYVNVTSSNGIDFRNKELVNGQVNITLDGLLADNYNILVSYSGDEKYEVASDSIVLVVASTKTSLEILPLSTQMVGDDVEVNVKINAEGNVILYVNGMEFDNIVISDGWANFTIPSISADVNLVNIFAIYESNGYYTSAFNSTTFNVEKYNTTISASSNNVNVTVQLLIGTTGNVIVTFNGVNYTGVVNSATGVAVVTLPKVSGTYNLPVYYNGDGNYNPNSTIVSVNIPWGADYLLNATVNSTGYVTVNINASATKNVTISWDSVSPVNVSLELMGDVKVGYYQLPEVLSAGSHIVTVSYAGDDNLGAKSYSLIYNMAKKSSLIKDVLVNPVIEGTKSVINVTMNSTESGSVIVEINGINYTVGLKNGNAVFEIVLDSTTDGKVYYLGDDQFEPTSHCDFTAVVNPKHDSIIVINTPVLNIGESTTVNATVNGKIVEDVGYTINGLVTDSITCVEAINYTITAVFEGNSTHKANSTTKVFHVYKITPIITPIITPNNIVYGNDTTISVNIGNGATGFIIITVDGIEYTAKIDTNGKASKTISNLVAGSDKVVIVAYDGNSKYNNATGSATFNIAKADSKFNYKITTPVEYPNDLIITVNADVNGHVTVTINGKPYGFNVTQGTNTLHISDLPVGKSSNNDKIRFEADNYNIFEESIEFEITKGNTVVVINDATSNIKLGEDALFIVNVVSDLQGLATGNVSVFVDNEYYSTVVLDVDYNNASVILKGLGVKKHIINVQYNGNSLYQVSENASIIITVAPADSCVVISDIDDVDYPDDVIVNYNVINKTSIVVIVKDAYDNIITEGVDISVDGMVTISGLYPGKYTINITNVENANYTKYSAISKFNVFKQEQARINPVITISDIGGHVGDIVNATVTIKGGDATGFIIYNGLSYIVEKGLVIIPVKLSKVGMQSITVIYTGDSKYDNGTGVKAFNVDKTETTITLLDDVINTTIGEDVEIEYSISPDVGEGNVTLWINDNVYGTFEITKSTGSILITSPYLPVNGSYNIKVQYIGTINYDDSNIDMLTVNVNKIDIDDKITISGSEVDYGETATVIIDFGELVDVTGSVYVTVDGVNGIFNATIKNGLAVVEIPGLIANNYTVTKVEYSGDEKYNSFTIEDTNTVIKVDKATSSVIITHENDSEGNVVVSMDVGHATGQVNMIINGTDHLITIQDGKANYTINGSMYGEYNITVLYLGDNNYNPNVNVTNFTVSDGRTHVDPDSAFNYTDKDNPLNMGINLPSDATGNFTVMVDGKAYKTVALVGGSASVDLSSLPAGAHDVELVYSGDENYSAISKSEKVIVSSHTPVSPGNPDSVFSIPDGNSIPLVFIVNLPSDATGNFTVGIGGKDYTTTIVNGKANISVSNLSSGSYSVVVSYSGDNKYTPLFKTATLNVSTPTPTPKPTPSKETSVFKFLSAKKYTFKKSKATKTIKVTLQTSAGKKLGKVKVVFKFDKKSLKKIKAKGSKGKKMLKQLKKGYTVTTSAKGVASLKLKNKLLNFKKGKYAFTVTFNGNDAYNKASGKGTMKIK